MSKYSLLLLALLLLGSCKSLRTNKEGPLELRKKSARFLLKRLVQNQLDGEWFSARAKYTYRDDYELVKFTGYIRMQKDSLIWMNFRKLSVEAARVLITPDSIYLLDRLNKEYLIKDLSFLQTRFHFPVNFKSLQTLLLGNPVFFETDLESSIQDDFYALTGAGERYANTFLLDGLGYLLRKLLIEDLNQQRALQIELSDYQSINEMQNFAYFRNFAVSTKETGDISVDVQFSKVTLDDVPKEIKFEVPDRYTKIE